MKEIRELRNEIKNANQDTNKDSPVLLEIQKDIKSLNESISKNEGNFNLIPSKVNNQISKQQKCIERKEKD